MTCAFQHHDAIAILSLCKVFCSFMDYSVEECVHPVPHFILEENIGGSDSVLEPIVINVQSVKTRKAEATTYQLSSLNWKKLERLCVANQKTTTKDRVKHVGVEEYQLTKLVCTSDAFQCAEIRQEERWSEVWLKLSLVSFRTIHFCQKKRILNPKAVPRILWHKLPLISSVVSLW